MTFSSLSVENLSTAPPATQVRVQTAKYPIGDTPQYVGQSWTFVFVDSPASNAVTNRQIRVADGPGNVIS